jgi:cell division protein FtsL
MVGLGFRNLNCFAVTLAVVVFAVSVSATIVAWYQYDQTYLISTSDSQTLSSSGSSTLNYTRLYYDLEGVTTNTKVNNIASNNFDEYDSSTDVHQVFKLVQAFVLVALLLSVIIAVFLTLMFFDGVRDKLMFHIGANVLRLSVIIVGVVILLAFVIAFLVFLGITAAFDSDKPNCTLGPCQKFVDDQQSNIGTITINSVSYTLTSDTKWGPAAGWFLVLANIPLSLLFIIVVALNKFPLPVDSMGSGEAL